MIKVMMNDLYPIIEDKINSDGSINLTVSGISMYPMLKDKVDTIKLVKVIRPLKKNDLPLYKRDNGQYVLHRIVKKNKDGTFNIRGDNQIVTEKKVRNDQIIAICVEFTHKGKKYTTNCFRYKTYVFFWNLLYVFRYLFVRFCNLFRKIAKKNNTTK